MMIMLSDASRRPLKLARLSRVSLTAKDSESARDQWRDSWGIRTGMDQVRFDQILL